MSKEQTSPPAAATTAAAAPESAPATSKKQVLAALKKSGITEIVDFVVVDRKTGKREAEIRGLTEADILSIGATQCVLADGRKIAFA